MPHRPLGPAAGGRVLLIHGWAASGGLWGDLPMALGSAGHRVDAVDLPGWGAARAPRSFAHDAAAYADALAHHARPEDPVDIVAHSMGVQTAIVLAHRAGEGVRRLVLMSPPIVPVSPPVIPPRSLVDLVALPVVGVPAARLLMWGMKRRPPAPEVRYRRTVGDPATLQHPAAKDIIRRQEALFARTPTRTLARALRAAALAEVRPLARTVTQETLVVMGGRDRVVDPREGDELVAIMPRARLLHLPAVGHVPHMEAADEVLSQILQHLQAPRPPHP